MGQRDDDRSASHDSPGDPRPLAQLKRCHRRLEQAVDALRAAARDHDLETASEVSAFFGRQIRRHENDEEESLFPRLLASSHLELRASIDRLSAEHRKHEALHERLERAVSGRAGDPWSELAALAEELSSAYGAHIEQEEKALFPAALTVLTDGDLDAIATEMDARRGR